MKPTIYDLLAKETVSEVTTAQLNSAVKVTSVDRDTVDFWSGPITLDRVLQTRTYPHGFPIPELGTVLNSPPFAESAHTFQPEGTEIWQVMGIQVVADGGTDTALVSLTDGISSCLVDSGATSTSVQSFFPYGAPFLITNSLYLEIENSGPNNFTAAVAYIKVGL